MVSGKRLQKNGRSMRKRSIDTYLALQKNLQQYSIEKNKVLRIRDIDRLNTTRARIIERNYWERFYFGFTEFLYEKADDNYVGSQIKLLRAFFNYLNERMEPAVGDFYKQFYATKEEVPVVVLYPERLNFLIYDKEFEKKLPKHLKKHKDMFVFGCSTALRFSDLVNLKPSNLEHLNNNVYVSYRSIKTSTYTRVYLPDYAKDILKKYKRRKKSLFPPISNVNFNVAIKKIALLAGWTEAVEKTRNKRGQPFAHFKDEKNTVNYRFCDLLASHTMRRTAITTMLLCGMNEMNVRIISGHKANSTSFYRYVNYSDSFMDDEMEAFHERMKKRVFSE